MFVRSEQSRFQRTALRAAVLATVAVAGLATARSAAAQYYYRAAYPVPAYPYFPHDPSYAYDAHDDAYPHRGGVHRGWGGGQVERGGDHARWGGHAGTR